MDSGQPIDIEFSGAEFQSREEFKMISRVNLGYLECEYNIDTDLSVVIFYKSNNDMDWQQTSVITLDKDEKRIFRKLPNGITVIDFYVKLYGSVDDIFEMSVFRILVKQVILGKHN